MPIPSPIPVVLVPYDPEWPNMAEREMAYLFGLGPNVVAVHHVGSTSVPGLSAKPIIDLMPLVKELGKLDRCRAEIEAIGYQWHGEFSIPGRRYCTISDEAGTRLVQAHFFAVDSPEVTRHLAFRDYLRSHPDIAKAYEVEKRRARDLHPDNSHAYTDEKDAWIRKTEAEALAWYATLDHGEAAR